MNDTTPEMEKLHRELLMQRSGEERVQLFLRFYGNDVDEKMKARIVAELRGSAPAGGE